MGVWTGSAICQAAIEVAEGILWEPVIYNGVSINAKVWRNPQAGSQDGVFNFEYMIEFKVSDVAEPIYNCPVVIDSKNLFSGEIVDNTSTLTWTVRCPQRGV